MSANFKKVFMKNKKKIINIFIIFLIFHKNNSKVFLKLFFNGWPKGTC